MNRRICKWGLATWMLGCVHACLALSGIGAAPSFDARLHSASGSAHYSMVVNDFNSDGLLDIGMADFYGLSVCLGNGNGRFDNVSYEDAGHFASAMAAGDLNGDGKTDLVVGSYPGLNLFIGDGAGHFTSSTLSNYSANPTDIKLADFDGDSHLDILVADSVNYAGSTLAWLKGDGAGNFAESQRLTTDVTAAFTVADMNKDGLPDIVAAGRPTIYLNDGNGKLASPRVYSDASAPVNVTCADVNNDGKLDVLYTTYESESLTASDVSVCVRLGDGSGNLGEERSFAAAGHGNAPRALIGTGDFNDDGLIDVVAAEQPDLLDEKSRTLGLLLGDGSGGFKLSQYYAREAWPEALAAADFNGDGKADIAMSDGSFQGIATFLGDGSGHLQDGKYRRLPSFFEWIAVADFNHDGKDDLVATNYELEGLSVLPGNSSGFGALIPYSMGPHVCEQCSPKVGPIYVLPADFNNDGQSDVATVNLYDGMMSILLGNGAGSFKERANFSYGGNGDLPVIGDFNGDGNQDVADVHTFDSYFRVYNGDGKGNLADSRQIDTSKSGTFLRGGSAGLLDGDSISDIALYTSEGVVLAFGTQDGKFKLRLLSDIQGFPYVADLNGDGFADLLVSNAYNWDTVKSTTVLLGDGTGNFQPVWTSPRMMVLIGAADFNGDGFPDIAVNDATFNNGSLEVWSGNGTGQFSQPVEFGPAGQAVIVDFNHDGRPDIVSEASYGFTMVSNTSSGGGGGGGNEGLADLTATWKSLKLSDCNKGGCKGRAVLRLENASSKTAGAFDVQFILSADNQLSDDDVLLDTKRLRQLQAGEHRKVPVKLPRSNFETSSTLWARIDSGDVISESNDENNVVPLLVH